MSLQLELDGKKVMSIRAEYNVSPNGVSQMWNLTVASQWFESDNVVHVLLSFLDGVHTRMHATTVNYTLDVTT